MKIDIKAEAKQPSKEVDLWDQGDSRKVGDQIITQILRRTGAGQGADGDSFRPYSASYAKKKGSSRVDLKETGNLLRSIKVTQVSESTITVAVTGSAADYAEHVDADRPFLGLTPAEAEKLLDGITAEMTAALAGSSTKKGPVV